MADENGFTTNLGITFPVLEKDHAEAMMPITPFIKQPFGFVHGGATLTLLETVASRAAMERMDMEKDILFGIGIDARHVRPGVEGYIHATADIIGEDGEKQYWNVAAYDDDGNLMSDGMFTTQIISKERFEQRMAEKNA